MVGSEEHVGPEDPLDPGQVRHSGTAGLGSLGGSCALSIQI